MWYLLNKLSQSVDQPESAQGAETLNLPHELCPQSQGPRDPQNIVLCIGLNLSSVQSLWLFRTGLFGVTRKNWLFRRPPPAFQNGLVRKAGSSEQ